MDSKPILLATPARWYICDSCGQSVDRQSLFEVFQHALLGHTRLSTYETTHFIRLL